MFDPLRYSLCYLTGAVPTPRYFHSCAIHNGSMYVFGGYNGSDRLCDFFEHNFETGVWTELVSYLFVCLVLILFLSEERFLLVT